MIDELIDTYKGIEIRVNGKGKFEAIIGKKKYSRASLGSVRNMIDKQSDPVHLMKMNERYFAINPIEFNGIKRRDGRIQEIPDGKISRSWDAVYYFDQPSFDRLQEISEQIMALVEKSLEIANTLKRF